MSVIGVQTTSMWSSDPIRRTQQSITHEKIYVTIRFKPIWHAFLCVCVSSALFSVIEFIFCVIYNGPYESVVFCLTSKRKSYYDHVENLTFTCINMVANKQPLTARASKIRFHMEDECSVRKTLITTKWKLLSRALH